MSAPANCCQNCGTAIPQNIPGTAGAGASTIVGVGGFVVPALGAQVTIPLANTSELGEGNGYFVETAGYFELDTILSATSAIFTYLNIAANTTSGNSIAAGEKVVPGSIGSDGTDGSPAWTVVTAPGFTVPAVTVTETIPVASNVWMAIGQKIFIQGAGVFQVATKVGTTSITAVYLDYADNTNAGAVIAANAQVSPSGTQPDITGLGNNITRDFDDALAYNITNSYATITGITVTVPAAGSYKVEACVTVLYTGVTFAASRLLSMRLRNTTQSTTAIDKTVETGIHTTLTFPAFDYVLPPNNATLALNDVLELQIQLDTVESAGSSVVTDAFIVLTPLDVT